ncbi:hypothetical protein DMB85_017865, partial [Pectobacterium aquaticum]
MLIDELNATTPATSYDAAGTFLICDQSESTLISAVPSNATPLIFRAVASLVAAAAVPPAVSAPTSPAVSTISADSALPLTVRPDG